MARPPGRPYFITDEDRQLFKIIDQLGDIEKRLTALEGKLIALNQTFAKNDLLRRVEAIEKAMNTPGPAMPGRQP